jgi:hypothetical protein
MSDEFLIYFSTAEQTAQGLIQDAELLYDTLAQMQRAAGMLLSGGLQGAFLDEIQARCQYIENSLRNLGDETDEAGRDLQTVVQRARDLDSQCAVSFNLPPGFSLGGGNYTPNPYILPYPINLSGGDSNPAYPLSGVDFKNFPYHLIQGRYDRAYAEAGFGYMTDEEIEDWLNDDPLAHKWSDYVDARMTFANVQQSASLAAAEGYVTGNFGSLHTAVGSVEAKAGASLTFGEDGFKAKTDFETGIYAIKAEANAEIAGVDIMAEGYVGANASGSAAATFDPMNGEIGVNAELDFFAGGRVEAEATSDLGAMDVGVQGSLSYGIGFTANADIGMDDSVFRADVELGATLGLGGEIGFTVEVDFQEAANDVAEFTHSLADLGDQLFGGWL